MTNARLLWSGFVAGIIGIGCCVSPVILALLGLISAASAIDLAYGLYGNYAWYFRFIGLVILAVAVYFYLKRRNQCTLDGVYKNKGLIIGSLLIFLLTYFAFYWLTTLLGILVQR